MAESQKITQTQLPDYQDAFLRRIFSTANQLGDVPISTPGQQVAGFSPAQQQAMNLGLSGIGSYAPMMQAGAGNLGAGASAIGTGIGTTMSGAPLLSQSVGAYDPNSYQSYMDPYMDEVVQQAEADIGRQGQIAQQGLDANAVNAGAFGGSRQAIAQQELQRNVADQQARTGSQLRSAGYQQAQGQAQNAFQNQMARQQSAAQLFGALGQGLGSLGSDLGKLGLSQGALGESSQAAGMRDVDMLSGLGGMQQGQRQAELDAARNSFMTQQYEPYQRLGFMSDIFQGIPSSGQTITSATGPDASMMSQIGGLGMGIAGLSRMGGLFGGGGTGIGALLGMG
tara:strand:- start:1697 stop:2713 length:1017 start_codon:yes stop_codon:yes gene_type:complete